MYIPDFHDFRPGKAAREMIRHGFTCLDDFSSQNEAPAREELMDALGFAADEIDLVTDTFETTYGPVRVFRDKARVSRAKAKAFVALHRSLS